MKYLLLMTILAGGAGIGAYIATHPTAPSGVAQAAKSEGLGPMASAAATAASTEDSVAPIKYPRGSIGDLTQQLNSLLAEPDSRRITQVPTKPYISPGLEIHGPNFTSFDTYTVQTGEDGATFDYKQSSWNQGPDDIKAAGRVFIDLPNLDPSKFTSVAYQYWPSLTEGLPASHLVVIESSDKLTGSVYRPDPQPTTLPRFGLGFVHEADARKTIQFFESMRDRGQFEAQVRDGLPYLETFLERSNLYSEISKRLQEQGTLAGFFGAASSVTASLSAPSWFDPMSSETQAFMQDLSRGLAALNAPKALEELRFGHLTTANGVIDSPEAMDEAMVHAEQEFAESKLQSLPADQRDRIIADVNKAMSGTLFDTAAVTFPAIAAAKEVLDGKRRSTGDPNATLDYGNLDERIQIGIAAAQKFREKA